MVFDEKLSWWPMVNDILVRARAKIWSLVKCREAGASPDQLLPLYIASVRDLLEYSAQVYDPLINESQAAELEAVQRSCLQIVLGCRSRSYAANMAALDVPSLAARRKELVKNFAISCFRSPSHRWWFTPHPSPPLNTRTWTPRLLEPASKLMRGDRRPIVAYTRALNALSDDEWTRLKLPPVSSIPMFANLQLQDL